MKISFESKDKDVVLIEHDGAVLCAFMKTGHIRALSRLRFSADGRASLNAISVGHASDAQASAADSGGRIAPFAVVFVTEDEEGERLRIVERFESEEDAEQAAKRIRGVLRTHASWLRLRARARAFGWYMAFPLLVFGLYGPVSSALVGKNGPPDMSSAILAEVTKIAASEGAEIGSPVPGKGAVRLLDGAAMVRLMPETSAGKAAAPVFAFSDPKCPACMAVEGALEEVANERPVVIVPVAFKAGSEAIASGVLCQEGQAEMTKAWRSAMQVDPLTPNRALKEAASAGECERGRIGVKINAAIFNHLGLTKTPTLMSVDGRVMEGGGTAAQITAFVTNSGN